MEESTEDVLVGCFGKKGKRIKSARGAHAPALVPPQKLASPGLRRPPAASSWGLAESVTTQSTVCRHTTEPDRCTLLKGAILVDGHLATQTAKLALPPSVTWLQ